MISCDYRGSVQIYFISRGKLRPANKQYSSIKNDYELNMVDDTEVELVGVVITSSLHHCYIYHTGGCGHYIIITSLLYIYYTGGCGHYIIITSLLYIVCVCEVDFSYSAQRERQICPPYSTTSLP